MSLSKSKCLSFKQLFTILKCTVPLSRITFTNVLPILIPIRHRLERSGSDERLQGDYGQAGSIQGTESGRKVGGLGQCGLLQEAQSGTLKFKTSRIF